MNPGARVCPGAVLDLVEQREAFSDYPCLEHSANAVPDGLL